MQVKSSDTIRGKIFTYVTLSQKRDTVISQSNVREALKNGHSDFTSTSLQLHIDGHKVQYDVPVTVP